MNTDTERAAFEAWFYEVENFATRGERLAESDFDDAMLAAFKAGRASLAQAPVEALTEQWLTEAEALIDEYGRYRWDAGGSAATFDKIGEHHADKEADEARAALLSHLRLRPQAQAPKLVMADGSPLLEYLDVGDDPPNTDEWTKGYHEARRRLYRILAPQLDNSGAQAVAPTWSREEIDAVADRLGDDAALLRGEYGEDERADNMDRAASMLTVFAMRAHPTVQAQLTDGGPAFDPTKPCDMQRVRDGWKPGWGGMPTMCERCKNPHHACDGGAASPSASKTPPVNMDCPRCFGSGDRAGVDCIPCGGSGKVTPEHHAELMNPFGTYEAKAVGKAPTNGEQQ